MAKRKRKPNTVAELSVTVEANADHVTAVIWIDEATTIGLRFVSPEHMLEFFAQLTDKAAEVWPDHPLIKYYQSDEDDANQTQP